MKRRLLLCLFGTMIALGGCGSNSPISISGIINYNGQPVASARVGFVPKTGSAGDSPMGETDATGKFSLRVPPGEYAVTVSPKLPEASSDDYSVPTSKSTLPMRYGDPAVTDLKATVASGGDNQFTFDLKD